ncbi:Krr1-domain-containing protein [Obba rivulosa]|uniref:Krr1-domain-containing protein n=1 Tax=Obba rivulosa TaxID=1052685 RepID=A0A8E2AV03_9APHY|nr:Krr1-domain-containing protein [Obba rivulosa]
MLSEDSDTESIHQLTINEHYAKAFEYKKEREELAKLKEKYGSDIDEEDVDEEDSEEAESEDEDGEELTPAVDVAILRTLARIKKRDPSIYEKGKDVFEEERQKTGEAKISRATKDKSKPLTMRQHALASALDFESRSPSPEPLTHVQEQAALREETIAAFHTAVDSKEEEDDLLIPREKTKDELEQEEEEYRAFLQREVGKDLEGLITVDESDVLRTGNEEDAVKEDRKDKDKKKKEKKGEAKKNKEGDQEFLMNYILNRGWIDKSARHLPTYKEITDSGGGKGKAKSGDAARDSDSENDDENDSQGSSTEGGILDENEFDEVADRFESSYNFRFEEPDAATIARYPRNLSSLVRRQDTSRKEAREKRKARKEEELLKKKEEVKRLKALKKKEIFAKLEMISKEGGKKLEESTALQELDLEGDWDPEAHDRQMAAVYADEEEDGIIDEEKPIWDDDIDVGDIVPPSEDETDGGKAKKKKKKKKKKEQEQEQDEGGVDIDEMDADVETLLPGEEEWDGTEEMRKKVMEKYLDEVYELDFNDMVGDMPTRFKYTKVAPQTFGLSPEEILMATDAELNSYVGVKKLAPYRKEGKGKNWDNSRTAKLKELRDKLSERGIASQQRGGKAEKPEKKRKGKKERMRERATAAPTDVDMDAVGDGEEGAADEMQGTGKRKESKDVHGGEGHAKKKRRRHKMSDVNPES